ncbi:hypothetical protein ACFV5G_06270 [Streptomyces sp. NPDC059766]|uniref:hypothetical protein n=1 Tax=Streptomyces sp. NPDC059766 TaxID=3346940 RepID=UPI003661FD7A
MKATRFSTRTATALLLGLTAVTAPGAADAYASSNIPLPIEHFAHLVVDAPHGHLYISGGTGTDGILVTDLDGGNPTTISAAPGATGLALSADGSVLYAALPDQDAITAISTQDLTESARYDTGAGTRPDSLAVAGGTLWFGYGTTDAGGIGSVDPTGTVTLAQDHGSWTVRPTLATTPTPSGVLVAGAQTGDTSAFVTYRAEDGALAQQAATTLPVPDLDDFAVTADGQHLAVSSWARHSADRYRTSDLTVDGSFAVPVAGKAVAVAPDGTMAGCTCNVGFQTFPETGPGTYHTYFQGAPLRLAAHGLAWAPDSSRLYAVAMDPSGTPTLEIDSAPETAQVTIYSGSFNSGLAPGEPYAFEAGFHSSLRLAAGESVPPGTVRITRYDAADPDGVVVTNPPLIPPHFPYDPFGSYEISGIAPPTGPLSYRVDYSGGGHYAPATTTFDMNVVKYAPTMTLAAPSTGTRGTPMTFTGRLTWPHAHANTGMVHVNKTDLAHPFGYEAATLPVAADGGFVFHDTPQAGGTNTYVFSYDGGTSYLRVAKSAIVQIPRATTGLGVTTDAKSYHSGATVKVTAHLGTTYNSRTVTLYDQPAGKPRAALRTGKVDAHGNLVAYLKVSRNTVFSAAFAGDYRYAPRTVATGTTLTPTIRTETQWPLATTRIGSTTYQVFYKSEINMGYNLKVTPHQTGACASVYVERYTAGAWHQVTSQRCVPLYADGQYGYGRALKLYASNGRYRIRGIYAPPTTGAQTGGATTPWTYLTVRPGSPR